MSEDRVDLLFYERTYVSAMLYALMEKNTEKGEEYLQLAKQLDRLYPINFKIVTILLMQQLDQFAQTTDIIDRLGKQLDAQTKAGEADDGEN